MKTKYLITGLFASSAFVLFGQDEKAEADDVFNLSPFVVDASKDTGYLASQTLAGTRLATDLKDAPSPVTVLTMEFLEDIDATDINDALSFVPAVDDDPRPYNSLNNNPVSSRIRGFQQTNTNVNFFPTRTTTDRYNIDRIEINRGPNAILFGIGNPGGTYVATTKNAELRKNFGWVENRVDTLDSWRFAGDWNQVVIEDRLAIRIAGMTEDRKGFIEPMSDRDKRFYIALNAKIADTKNYDLSVRYQFEDVSQVTTTRAWNLPWDNITAWQDAGSPTYDSPDQVPAALRWPAGMTRIPNAFTIAPVISGSEVNVPTFTYGNRPASMQSRSDNNQRYRIGTPLSRATIPGTDIPIPTDLSYQGAAWGYTLDSDSHAVFVEQTFFDKLFTEIAWYQQSVDRDWNRSNGGQDLYVDVLEFLPNGDSNPNVGKVFTQGTPRVQQQYREIEVGRLTVGYELDLRDTADWLGRHRFGVLLESSRDLLGLNDLLEVNLLTDRPGAFQSDLTNFGNRTVRRSYLFTGYGNVWQGMANPGRDAYSSISGLVDPSSVQSEAGDRFATELANFRVSRGETETDSWVFSMQSFFPAPGFGNIRERLVPFWGLRKDDQVSTQLIQSEMNASKVRGVFPDWRTLPYERASTFDDTTLTWGVVYRITPFIDLFYNESEVLSPGSSRQDVFGETISSSTGEGWDAGVRFELLDGKLVGSFSVFESTQLNIPLFNIIGGNVGAQFPDPTNNLLDALIEVQEGTDQPAGFPDLNYGAAQVEIADPIDTFDNEAEGMDWEITYNPKPNWRISFRGQKMENKESNVLNRSFRHFQEFLLPIEAAFISTGLDDWDIPDYDRTISEFFADTRQEIANDKFSREGTLAIRSSKWRYTLVTNYSFRKGPLKGISIGGNLRYSSKKAIQAIIDPQTGFTGAYVYDDPNYILGMNLGYWKKFSNGVIMNIRLNISNVLDNDDFSVQSANSITGEIYALRPVEGREASLTTSFRF
ncbi:TonB-dependent receptor plug domain-containing protein [Puniceicoccales bacterium CK1056]|uniref:TonB-dependent receptor plug domain-containing protein n=1 Tax=Oceanipulchritudo coccoides TaxID=2706888 RepID=A0A6B2LZ17_9BACT|nr:TonB-dependent receptor plug domain-containing protein [Oceanipulchritudo coccoides]NDV61878.1 TonB-dependent receptor plug domain-containing protein [Oceanipulchritudo coccoides]